MNSHLYEHATEPDERDDVYLPDLPSPFSCSLCGGRDWPSETSDCPLCREESETKTIDEP